MKKRLLAMLLATALIAGCFAACGGKDDGSKASTPAGNDTSTAETPKEESTGGGEEPANAAAGPDDTSELYEFTVYYNYAGWTKQWGMDEASKYMSEKFNININWYGPDSDPDTKLNLMVSGDDLPEVIVLDRGPNLNKIARGGYLQDLAQYMYEGNDLQGNIPQATLDLLKIDGANYGVPNWARKGATGGNYQWMFNTAAYEAVGSPDIKTFEDLHQYALAIKEAGLKSYSGQDIYPFWCTNTDNGLYVYQPFYRAMGMPNLVADYFTQEGSKIQFGVESENFVAALKSANQWYNEGLFNAEVFTDNQDQFLEKVTNGRPALLWYDFSMDDTHNFRRVVREQSELATSYEVLGSEAFKPEAMLFPGTEGVDVTYGDEAGTIGWNVNCITTKAENPQRIFDLLSWQLSKDGAINMMYGPEGGLWEGLDEIGNPIIKKPQSEITSAEMDAAGAWFWAQPAQSDNVDNTKFAVNDKETPEGKSWVIDIQAHVTSFNEESPRIGQKFVTDQLTGLTDTVDPQSDLGVNFQSIKDYSKAQLPKIIMAADDAEFDSLVADLLKYAKDNNVDDICASFQGRFDENVSTQGFNAYDEDYDLYRLK
jgi:ABC-type sugar transport system, periplasmic component